MTSSQIDFKPKADMLPVREAACASRAQVSLLKVGQGEILRLILRFQLNVSSTVILPRSYVRRGKLFISHAVEYGAQKKLQVVTPCSLWTELVLTGQALLQLLGS